MDTFRTALAAVEALRPSVPVHVFRPRAIEKAVSYFKNNFAGNVLYAVKTSPDPVVLQAIWDNGVRHYDVASIAEVRHVRAVLPEAKLYFMHTVKSRQAIREAYFTHGVRHFSLDTPGELAKILQETDQATDLALHVRLAIPNAYAEISLADKFGIAAEEAPALLVEARKVAQHLGVCFHVGSQCMHPDAWRIAIRMAHSAARKAGVRVDSLDVGGGFPSVYPGMIPPPMGQFFDTIHTEFAHWQADGVTQLLAEPGRALVAESGGVLVRVELRKGHHLYINDGTYGSLFDAGTPKFIFPVRLLRPDGEGMSPDLVPFSFFGPTCDTLDFMKGPFYLPEDIREGDYIEVGQLGAYGQTLVTGFNGFTPAPDKIRLDDAPLMTMYDGDQPMLEPMATMAA